MSDKNSIPDPETKKYEQDLTDYLHLQIEETQTPDSELEKKVVPESVRGRSFWRHFHIRRRILVSRTAGFFKDTKKMILTIAILFGIGGLGVFLEWDREILGGTVVFFGLVSSVFSWLAAGILGVIGLIPFVGPIIVTALSSSILWIINALGYFVSIVAIKAGHGKTVLNYRLVVIVFLTGIVTGYVVARLVH